MSVCRICISWPRPDRIWRAVCTYCPPEAALQQAPPSVLLQRIETEHRRYLFAVGQRAQIAALDQQMNALRARPLPLPEWLPPEPGKAREAVQYASRRWPQGRRRHSFCGCRPCTTNTTWPRRWAVCICWSGMSATCRSCPPPNTSPGSPAGPAISRPRTWRPISTRRICIVCCVSVSRRPMWSRRWCCVTRAGRGSSNCSPACSVCPASRTWTRAVWSR